MDPGPETSIREAPDGWHLLVTCACGPQIMPAEQLRAWPLAKDGKRHVPVIDFARRMRCRRCREHPRFVCWQRDGVGIHDLRDAREVLGGPEGIGG